MSAPLVLVSHALCPYVQRAAIVLVEKGVPFERRDIELANKPDWFLRVSPLGKTPVLLVGDEPIFESAVICEYLEETALPRLHPANALQRAQHRSWMEFGSALLNAIGSFYNAADETALVARAVDIRARLVQLEAALGEGPHFAGESFSVVDAVFGPVFRYFDVFDAIDDFGFWSGLPKVRRWRRALALRPSPDGAPCGCARWASPQPLVHSHNCEQGRCWHARWHGSISSLGTSRYGSRYRDVGRPRRRILRLTTNWSCWASSKVLRR